MKYRSYRGGYDTIKEKNVTLEGGRISYAIRRTIRVWNTFTYNTYVLYVRFEFTSKQVVVKMNHEMDSSYLAQS